VKEESFTENSTESPAIVASVMTVCGSGLDNSSWNDAQIEKLSPNDIGGERILEFD
jgi:hypothetical protein